MAIFNLVNAKQLSAEQRFGRLVRSLRVAASLSQREVAAAMSDRGHTTWMQTTVTKTEAGERALRLNEYLTLCDVLGHDPVDATRTLLHEEVDPQEAALVAIRAASRVVHQQMRATEVQRSELFAQAAALQDQYLELGGDPEAWYARSEVDAQ